MRPGLRARPRSKCVPSSSLVLAWSGSSCPSQEQDPYLCSSRSHGWCRCATEVRQPEFLPGSSWLAEAPPPIIGVSPSAAALASEWHTACSIAKGEHRTTRIARAHSRETMPAYTLPDRPYDYGALEPHISGTLMQLHHDQHHATYVKGANATLEHLDEARNKSDFTRLAALEKSLAFNLSGHILHSLFWQNLAPQAGGRPEKELADCLQRDFGGFDQFKQQLSQAAASIMGSGWAALVWEPLGRRLLTTQIYDHQSNLSQAGIPLLVLDAWEHAYYLQYKNEKAKFFDAMWAVWNWQDVAERFNAARKVDVNLHDAAR